MDIYDEIKDFRENSDCCYGRDCDLLTWLELIRNQTAIVPLYKQVRVRVLLIAAICISAIESIDRQFANNDKLTKSHELKE